MPRKMSSKEKRSSDLAETRTRTWTFVLYEDSAPENWRDIIDELHVEWVEFLGICPGITAFQEAQCVDTG